MGKPVRIGAVEYLNSKPLICDLELLAPKAELALEVPSRLADDLAAGRLDVALIPVIEYFRAGCYRIVPDICIASRGPVLSVTLFSRVVIEEIRSLALDTGSRTSAALVQVLLSRRHNVRPVLQPLPLDQSADHADADAVLLIGDRAMRASLPGFPHSYDLGQEWHDWTELPFVYAVWAVRPGVELGEAAEALQEAKRRGKARVAQLAHDEAAKLGLDAGFCRRYLTNIIRFDLGPRELAGLERFYREACNLELAPEGVEVCFLGGPGPMDSPEKNLVLQT
jgi:chorismate dehydratase